MMNHPKIGIGILVVKDNKILLGERIHAHGAGTFCAPGGLLEFGETPSECAKRELLEEAGLTAQSITAGPWTNDFFEGQQKHYVTIFMIVKQFSGIPTVI